jgi:hypothetical protein
MFNWMQSALTMFTPTKVHTAQRLEKPAISMCRRTKGVIYAVLNLVYDKVPGIFGHELALLRTGFGPIDMSQPESSRSRRR